jgi:myo-inositol-1(or 4)-monophosphatase
LSDALFDKALDAVKMALRLFDTSNQEFRAIIDAGSTVPGEYKAGLDLELHAFFMEALRPAGIPVISEESSTGHPHTVDGLCFILDPLDGTYNYIRGAGGYGLSLALWDGLDPVFGIVSLIDEDRLYWGGPGRGAFCNGEPVSVSDIDSVGLAAVCGGFPVRFDRANNDAMSDYLDILSNFEKVRMLGSAATSLVYVAQGSFDAYYEKDIMLWDVAAGLAILKGAGGDFDMVPGHVALSFIVSATNGRMPSFKGCRS